MATISFVKRSEAVSDPETSIDISPISTGKFLFNDLYDAETIRNIIRKHRNSLYTANLCAQKTICYTTVYSGTMSEFRKREYYNELENIPKDAYACEVNFNVIPYFSKRAYYARYNGQPVNLIDIMHNDDIFAERCVCTIGEYGFMLLYMKPTSFGTILYILPDKNKGISEETLLSMIEEGVPYTIRFEPQSPIAYTYKRKGLIFKDGVVPGNILDWNDIIDHRNINVWKSYMSSSRTDVNLLCQADCTYDTDNNCFIYNEAYLEHALSHIENTKVFLFNQKNYAGYSLLNPSHYTGIFKEKPYFRIPMTEGMMPVPIENIRVYEYDTETNKTGTLLDNAEIKMQQYYPNIYQFEYSGDSTLRIEWDYVAEVPNTGFVNVFEEYIDFVGEDVYLEQVLTGTLPEPYKSFEPSPEVHPSVKEFLEGSWSTLDDYYVDQLKTILKERDDLYPEIYEELLAKDSDDNKLVVDVELTPQIPDRVTNNNSDAVTDPEDTEVWEDLFVWTTITNTTDTPYDVTVTVNGVFTEIDHTYIKDGYQYIYIPAELVGENSIIEVTVHQCPEESKSGEISFGRIESAIPMPPSMGKVASTSLLFYEVSTRRYLDLSLIKFSLKAEATYLPATMEINESMYDTIPKLTTSDNKAVITKDGKSFRVLTVRKVNDRSCYLMDSDKEVLLTFYKEPLTLYNDFVVVPGPDITGFNKLLPSEDLELSTDEPALIGMKIGVVTTNVHRIYKYDDIRHSDYVVIPEFKLDPHNDRFRLYIDGKLALPGIDYTYTPQTKYADDAEFKLINRTYTGNEEPVKLVIEYLPTRRKLVCNEYIDIEFNEDHSKLMLDIGEYLTLPITNGVTEIYLNGIYLPLSMVTVLQNTRIVVNTEYLTSSGVDIYDDLIITVFEESHDEDLYNYEDIKGNTLIGEFMETDDSFREFILSLE